MSLTNFESAIKGNMDAYSDTLKVLRNNEVMQRNSALAGLQTEMEKYGELAKIGLEIPMAVEGLKAVGGNVVNRVNQIKDFVGGKVSGVQEAVEEKISGAKSSLGGAVGDIRDTLTQRLDNLRTTSAYGGKSLQPGEQMGSMRDLAESKMEFNPTAKIKDSAMRSKNDVEMTETDDPNYFETKSSGDFSYGGSVSSGETKTSGSFQGFDDTDEYGLPRASEPIGTGEPSLFSQERQQSSTSRSLDAGFENDRMGIGNMGKSSRGAPLRKQPDQGYNELDTTEKAPPRPTSKAPGAGVYDDELSSSQSMETSGLDSAAKDALSMGTSEEEIGAGLLAIPGIGEVLGGIMEGIGAITEAGAVGAGAYGAVQSMMSADQEEALRQKPLAPIRMPTLDLGGSIGVPLMS